MCVCVCVCVCLSVCVCMCVCAFLLVVLMSGNGELVFYAGEGTLETFTTCQQGSYKVF